MLHYKICRIGQLKALNTYNLFVHTTHYVLRVNVVTLFYSSRTRLSHRHLINENDTILSYLSETNSNTETFQNS